VDAEKQNNELGGLTPYPEHEDRFLMLGMSLTLRVLVVSHCFRENDIIRIISARKADKNEQDSYWR